MSCWSSGGVGHTKTNGRFQVVLLIWMNRLSKPHAVNLKKRQVYATFTWSSSIHLAHHSAIHAREYTTAPLVLEFARWLVNGYGTNADATWILDHHEVHLMLHANPDGRKQAETGLSWRKNANNAYCANTNTRGADLNRNFSFSWNSTAGQGSSGNACDLTYRGPAAGSDGNPLDQRSLWKAALRQQPIQR